MNILGSEDRLELKYDTGDWKTFILQYSHVTEHGEDQCFFELNERRGFFKLHYDGIIDREFYLGGHPEKCNFAHVVLGNFEVYEKIFDAPNPSHYVLPDGVIKELNTDIECRWNDLDIRHCQRCIDKFECK